LRLLATPKTRPVFPAKSVIKKVKKLQRLEPYNGSSDRKPIGNCRAGAPPATASDGACPREMKRDGSALMTTRILGCCALGVLISAIANLRAQEASSPSPTPSPSPSPLPLSEALFKNLKARSIGPAVMGGRVSDIAIDPRNPFIFYVGLGHGGVFKTNDNGVTFQPIFDKQPMLSIGAVAVAPSDSDVVWGGTGEAKGRNSTGWGDGVYRSTDGGETWQNVGLKESRTIPRIVVDPKKPDVAYVAAMGNLWKDGGERGLFKTTDVG